MHMITILGVCDWKINTWMAILFYDIWNVENIPCSTSGQNEPCSFWKALRKPVWKSFYMSKDVVELDLSSSYICEEVWLVGICSKRSFVFFTEGQNWMSISDMTWFIMVLSGTSLIQVLSGHHNSYENVLDLCRNFVVLAKTCFTKMAIITAVTVTKNWIIYKKLSDLFCCVLRVCLYVIQT